jgi:1-acyl-sn-glycerol-3-phosphate acyltransferase
MYKYKDTIYYSDLLNDDFGSTIKEIPLPRHYKYYSENLINHFIDFIIYRVFVRPIALLYNKIKFHQKFVNKKLLKKVKGGYFIYSNHTAFAGDAFTPNILEFKRKNYIVVGRETASLTSIIYLLRTLGAIPLSNNMSDMKQYFNCIKKRSKNSSITIYPEAHIWPYYTDIRPFSSEAFKYPAKFNKPIFTLTNCYQKKKFGKRPRIISIINGPYYPKKEFNIKDNSIFLRNIAYQNMKYAATTYSTYEYYKYEYKEKN